MRRGSGKREARGDAALREAGDRRVWGVGGGGGTAIASVALLVATAISPSAGAQDTATLSLADAIRIAREHNPAYRSVLNDGEVAAAQVREGWGAFLPDVRASLSFGGSASRIVTGRDEFGNPVRRDDPLDFTASSASQGVSLGLTVFDGGARLGTLRAARATSHAAEARARSECVRLDAEVARRYDEALHAQRAIRLAETQLASARDQLAATEQLFRVAGANRVDVLGAQVDVATREQEVERARGEAEKAKLALREVLGVEDDTPFTLTTELPAVFDPDTLNADTLVAIALRWHPHLAELEAAREAAERQMGIAGASRWPTISASAGVSRALSRPDYGSLFEFNPPDRTLSFGISASIPLFDQFRTSMAVAQARAARSDADESLRTARLATERNVRSALIDLRNAYHSLQLAERSAALSRERVELAREQYRLGAIPFTTLQTVIDRDVTAQRAELDARFAFAIARVTLEEQVGREITP